MLDSSGMLLIVVIHKTGQTSGQSSRSDEIWWLEMLQPSEN